MLSLILIAALSQTGTCATGKPCSVTSLKVGDAGITFADGTRLSSKPSGGGDSDAGTALSTTARIESSCAVNANGTAYCSNDIPASFTGANVSTYNLMQGLNSPTTARWSNLSTVGSGGMCGEAQSICAMEGLPHATYKVAVITGNNSSWSTAVFRMHIGVAPSSVALDSVAVTTSSAALATKYAAVAYQSSVSLTHWYCCSGDGTNHSCTDMGVASQPYEKQPLLVSVDMRTPGHVRCTLKDLVDGGTLTADKTTNVFTDPAASGIAPDLTEARYYACNRMVTAETGFQAGLHLAKWSMSCQ